MATTCCLMKILRVGETTISSGTFLTEIRVGLSLSGADLSQIELSTLAERGLRDRLSKIAGVAKVILAGERRLSMRVWIDNRRLTAHSLTVADVVAALKRENVDLPSGRVEGEDREFTVRTLGELALPEEYAATTWFPLHLCS